MVAYALLTCHQGAALARNAARTYPVAERPAVEEPSLWLGERGTASFYGQKEDGRTSASGLRFDKRLLTAAHPWLPFGTRVRVTLGGTERSVVVTITDRLYSRRRIVDLSVAAARQLGIMQQGIAEVVLAPA